jgi:hypothetical protein
MYPLDLYRFGLYRYGFLVTVGLLNPELRSFSFIFIGARVSYAFFLFLSLGSVRLSVSSGNRRGWALLGL